MWKSPAGKRSNRVLVLTSLVVVLGLAGAYLFFRGREFHVTITQKEIDQALQAKFPMSKTHLVFFRVTYSNPQVTLLPGTNRIRVELDAELDAKFRDQSKKLGGSAGATFGLTYRNETKQFFLAEPVIDKLSFQGVPQEYLDKVTDFAASVAREYLQKHPVYTLRAKDVKTTAAKLLLKDVQVKGDEIDVTLGL